MPIAMWNGETIAEASDDQIEMVEGNVYFPPDAVRTELLQPSDTTSTCPWKGKASYYSIQVAEETNADAAWYYPEPLEGAKQIAGYVAFWRGVSVER